MRSRKNKERKRNSGKPVAKSNILLTYITKLKNDIQFGCHSFLYIILYTATKLQSLRKIKKYVKSLHKIIENWRIIANFMPKYVIL